MKIVMTLLVRDSEELLRDNLEFHLRQGVDFFVITDNASVDGTPGIVEEYVRAGLAELILEPEDTYSQARWVTRMARRAAEHGADWVINSDDDEFWSGRGGSLREALTEIPPRCDAVRAVRRNHPPLAVSAGPPRLETMVYRELQSFNALGNLLQPKVCHRAFADIEVAQGNHAVLKSGAPLPALDTDRLAISHFPVRGYAAFERKISLGGAAYARNTELDATVGAHWRWLYELLGRGELRRWYDGQLHAQDRIERGLAEGTLVFDDSVARALDPMREVACRRAG